MKTIVAEKLHSVSWDFAEAKTSPGPHGVHPYPAKFIPQIPRALIELFHPGDDSSVLDPFCGSGTTLVEAMSAGLPGIGIDLNPIATLVSKVKTTPLDQPLGHMAEKMCRAAQRSVAAGTFVIPEIPRLNHWFRREISAAIAALITEIKLVTDIDVADAFRVALSSIIVRVSNQDSDTRYAAIEKSVTQDSVWQGFIRAAASLGEAVSNLRPDMFTHRCLTRILTRDVMQVTPREVGHGVGLVVTSPPYPNAYEYWLYHKYRMYWLGMDPVSVRGVEIGARPHYFKKNHQTEADFERQMSRCFWLLSQVMKPRSYACFVVGRSIIHGREIDNEALLERAALPHGFKKLGSVQRTIAAKRKSFNLSHAAITREGILVFSRGQL